MALDLNGYIRQSYERPNKQILETLGANERLVEYLMETPGNTNWVIIDTIQGSEEEDWVTLTFAPMTITFQEEEGELFGVEGTQFRDFILNAGNGYIPLINANLHQFDGEDDYVDFIGVFDSFGTELGFEIICNLTDNQGVFFILADDNKYYVALPNVSAEPTQSAVIQYKLINGYIIHTITGQGNFDIYVPIGEQFTIELISPLYHWEDENGNTVIVPFTPTSDMTLTAVQNS